MFGGSSQGWQSMTERSLLKKVIGGYQSYEKVLKMGGIWEVPQQNFMKSPIKRQIILMVLGKLVNSEN